MKSMLYQIGRMLQLFGMLDLLYDIVSAGPLGPSPKIFTVGIVIFVVGWALTRLTRQV
jgi:hypothetical protein